MDLFIQYAIAAAQFAVDDARLVVTPETADAGRGLHRLGHRRVHHHRARAPGVPGGWPAAHLAVLHPLGDHQPGLGPGVDPLRRQGAELGHLHRLHRVGPRHRRRLRDHQARRRRRDDRRRLGSGGVRDGGRRLRRDAGPVDAQRRAGSGPAGRSTRTATASCSARAPASSSSRSWSGPRRAAPDLLRAGRLRDVGRRLPHDRPARRRRRRGAGDAGGAGLGRRRRPRSSTTSTPTAPRRRSTTRPRRWPSSASSATAPTGWRCRRPSR